MSRNSSVHLCRRETDSLPAPRASSRCRRFACGVSEFWSVPLGGRIRPPQNVRFREYLRLRLKHVPCRVPPNPAGAGRMSGPSPIPSNTGSPPFRSADLVIFGVHSGGGVIVHAVSVVVVGLGSL